MAAQGIPAPLAWVRFLQLLFLLTGYRKIWYSATFGMWRLEVRVLLLRYWVGMQGGSNPSLPIILVPVTFLIGTESWYRKMSSTHKAVAQEWKNGWAKKPYSLLLGRPNYYRSSGLAFGFISRNRGSNPSLPIKFDIV